MEQNHRQPGQLAHCLILTIVISSWLPSFAFFPPEGGLAIEKQLNENVSAEQKDTYNLSDAPVLLNLARVMGDFQQDAPVFSISSGALTNHPGIDLKSLAFNQSSPLRVPEELDMLDQGIKTTSKKEVHSEAPLMLSVLPFQAQSAGTTPTEPVCLPETVKLTVEVNDLSDNQLDFDFQGLSDAAETACQLKQEIERKTICQLPPHGALPSLIALSGPIESSTPFLFWTCHNNQFSNLGFSNKRDNKSSPQANFSGTFVACRQKTHINWIRSRQIGLLSGRVIAANRGGKLGFSTGAGSIEIGPGATALIDLTGERLLTVMALESPSTDAITVGLKNSVGKLITFSLLPGEMIIASGRNLTANELIVPMGIEMLNVSQINGVARGHFAVHELLSKEPLLDAINPELGDKERSALNNLKQRIAPETLTPLPPPQL